MRWTRLGWCASLLLAACSHDSTGVGAKLPPCTSGHGTAIALTAGQYVTIDPASDEGCTVFPANASPDSVEYLLVPQAATGTPDAQTSFTLTGAVPAAAPPVERLSGVVPPAVAFDGFRRRAEIAADYGPPLARSPRTLVAAAPPVQGSSRNFSVCPNLSCSGAFKTITATAKVVTAHLALYVDNQAPPGLVQADLDSLGVLFETRLYALDTTAFGRESDIDGNGVVMVLMTPAVNQLVDAATCLSSGFIAGFFYGLDLDPNSKFDSRSNQGEVFYSMVADSAGTLSCAHSTASVKNQVPVTFIHEFQHMISYNQHVLVRHGQAEVLWLNEGLSHFAEELGGRSFTPTDSFYVRGDLYNAYQYLNAPQTHTLVGVLGIGGLAERGGYWLFVRYLVDQFGAGLTHNLETTTLTGAANVATQTGQPFDQTVSRWALAQWVSGLPGVTVPPELQYTSWDFRSTFDSLSIAIPSRFPLAYPLVPLTAAGPLVSVSDQLHAGSGDYVRALQGPGAGGFTLLFGDGTGHALSAALTPRLSIVRIR